MFRDLREAGDVLEPARRRRNAVEVGPQPDVILTGDSNDVLDVRDHVLDPHVSGVAIVQERRKEVDSDDASASCECPKLLVGQVARVAAQRGDAGVARDRWLPGHLEHVVERRWRCMREVDDHAQAVHFGDTLATEGRQAAVQAIVRGRLAAVRPVVHRIPGQRNEPHSAFVEFMQPIEVWTDHVSALDSEERPKWGSLAGPRKVVAPPDAAQQAAGAMFEGVEEIQGTVGFGEVVGLASSGLHENGEDLDIDSGFDEARQVGVPDGEARGEVASVFRDLPEHVGMGIDDDGVVVELGRSVES